MNIPKEFFMNGKKVVLENEFVNTDGGKILAVIDFDRNFSDPDLNALPAEIIIAHTQQDEYLINKFNIVIGEVLNHVYVENKETL